MKLWPRSKYRQAKDVMRWFTESQQTVDLDSVILSSFLEQRQPGVTPEQIERDFFEVAQTRLNGESTINLTIDRNFQDSYSLSGKSMNKNYIHVSNLTIDSHFQKDLNFLELHFEEVRLHQNAQALTTFEGCKIKTLRVESRHSKFINQIILRNTWVGTLIFNTVCNSHFEMSGGGILNFECPPPSSASNESPFTGSVVFQDVFLARNSKDFYIKGPQPYRNLRTHLLKLENGPAVNLVHAAEQALEREKDTGFNKILSHLYEWFSDFGSSALRPFLWFVLILTANTELIYILDGAVIFPQKELFFGWREILMDGSDAGNLSRSMMLSFQSSYNPFGIFGARGFVEAQNIYLKAYLSISGFVSTILIALLVLALRRRFKMQ